MKDLYIAHENIRKFGYEIFSKLDIEPKIYKPVVDGLIETSLRGVDTHGIRLIPHYVRAIRIGRINKDPKLVFVKTSPTTAALNADHGFGITAGVKAMDKAIEIASKNGTGIVSVKNSTHFGAAAIYSLLAAKKNMIGLSFTNTDSLVVPYGGKRAYLGTNPICFAAPVEGEEPFCLDMATSKIPWNKVMISRKKKIKLEVNWAVDIDGKMTTNPEAAVALSPVGEYKGFGLGLMIEILCSILGGMPYGSDINPMYPLSRKKRYLSQFFLAIDIKRFQRIEDFKRNLKQMLDKIRSIPSAEGYEKVMVAGDPEKITYSERIEKGIPIGEEDRRTLVELAGEIGVDGSTFI